MKRSWGPEQLSFSFCYNSMFKATQDRKCDCLTRMKRLGKGPWRGHYRENLKVNVMRGSHCSEVSTSERECPAHPSVDFYGFVLILRLIWINYGDPQQGEPGWPWEPWRAEDALGRYNNETFLIVGSLSSTAGGMRSQGRWLRMR